jgi:hypothetical protein
MKTNELTGAALDWAVAKCEGGTGLWHDTVATYWVKLDGKDRALSKGWAQSYLPSTDWSQGGPIIEREKLCLDIDSAGVWLAWTKQNYDDEPRHMVSGPTPLIAAMRCYVASKLGDNVEIPTELGGTN